MASVSGPSSANPPIYAKALQTIESLRHRDPLIGGTITTAILTLATAASWFCPTYRMASLAGTVTSYGLAKFYGGKDGALAVFTNYLPKAAKLNRSLCKRIPETGEHGEWLGAGVRVRWSQFPDMRLGQGMARYLKEEGIESVWDFGCGSDEYSKVFLKEGIRSSGLDGNPQTPILSKGTGEVQDLAIPFQKEQRNCVISLEVGAKIPKEYEDQFLQNICNHAKKKIILSWPVEGQQGPRQLNRRNNDYIIAKMKAKGWEIDEPATQRLRNESHPIFYWSQDTLMVFKRKE